MLWMTDRTQVCKTRLKNFVTQHLKNILWPNSLQAVTEVRNTRYRVVVFNRENTQ